MKIYLITCLCVLNFFCFSNKKRYGDNCLKSGSITFTENKGQVSDQNYKPRPDILFSGSLKGMAFHLKSNGISYQLFKIESWKEKQNTNKNFETHQLAKQTPDEWSIFRLDINWQGINQSFVLEYDGELPGYNNYYSEVCPKGVFNVKTYNGIKYKNIYDKIDLHYYSKDGNLKYDYIVQPGADYKKIQLQVEGATKIETQKDGSLLLSTPFGNIVEEAPIVFQENKKIRSKWIVTGNCLSFEIGKFDTKLPLVIDPSTRSWGTYYGGDLDDVINSTCTDLFNNVFICGFTNSASMIATSGAYQVNYGSPAYSINKDAFLVKFNELGVRQWGTYYGDSGVQTGNGCTVDAFGSVYMVGENNGYNPLGILATVGAFQTVHGGGFIAKFDSAGARLWGTYYNGGLSSCKIDHTGNLYIAARGSATIGVTTANCHQASPAGWQDCILLKFTSNGARLWGTYYGGNFDEGWPSCSVDIYNNVYLSGYTNSQLGTAIATAGAYQINDSLRNGYDYDAFLAKFDSLGVRQWGTYYGANGFDWGNSCASDQSGNVYLAGTTSSSAMATSNSHQASIAGNYDAFLAKFDSFGNRIWATYYGDSDSDQGINCAVDKYGNVILCGTTSSTNTAIASSNAYQSNYGGGYDDAFLTKFDGNGVRTFGSYYGDDGSDKGNSCSVDQYGNIYLAGSTTSTNNIASLNSHQDTVISYFPGCTEGFLIKFKDCLSPIQPINITSPISPSICTGHSATLVVSGYGNVNWYSSLSNSISLGTGFTFNSPTLSTGNYSFYAEASSCGINTNRTMITLTAFPLPTLNIIGNNSVCQGGSIQQIVNGSALTYSWSNGTFGSLVTLTPSVTTIYTVIGFDQHNCKNSTTKTIYVNPLPVLSILNSSSIICIGETATLNVSGADFYFWNTGFTGANLIISPNITSSFTVVGTSVNGCSTEEVINQNVSACTSINEINQNNSYTISPNPFKNEFSITFNSNFEDITLEIYSSTGQLVFRSRSTFGEAKVNLGNYAQGIYFLSILKDKERMTRSKIVKE